MPEGERRALTEPGTLLDGLGFSFWYPPQPVVVGELTPGFPAEQAGLALGDRIVAVEGEPVDDYLEFVERIRGRAGQATALPCCAAASASNFELVPKAVDEEGRKIGKIGLGAARGDAGAVPGIDADGRALRAVRGALGPPRARPGKERAHGADAVEHRDRRRLGQEHHRADQHRRSTPGLDGDQGVSLTVSGSWPSLAI